MVDKNHTPRFIFPKNCQQVFYYDVYRRTEQKTALLSCMLSPYSCLELSLPRYTSRWFCWFHNVRFLRGCITSNVLNHKKMMTKAVMIVLLFAALFLSSSLLLRLQLWSFHKAWYFTTVYWEELSFSFFGVYRVLPILDAYIKRLVRSQLIDWAVHIRTFSRSDSYE